MPEAERKSTRTLTLFQIRKIVPGAIAEIVQNARERGNLPENTKLSDVLERGREEAQKPPSGELTNDQPL